MAAGKYAMLIEQGATLDLELEYKDSTNTPIDVSAYTGKLQIKSDYADNSPTTYLSLTNPVVNDTGIDFTTGGSSGVIGIKISATDTSALTFDTAIYDFEITDTNNVVTRLLQGTVQLSKQVTTT
jgi:hypothetical protein